MGSAERESRERFFFIFSLFISFSDLRKSDCRFSSGLKATRRELRVDTKKLEFR